MIMESSSPDDRDIKTHVSKKGGSKRKGRIATGNRESARVPLKPVELHVAQLCGRNYIEGAPELADGLSENHEVQDLFASGGVADGNIVDDVMEAHKVYGGEVPIYVVHDNDDLNNTTSDNLVVPVPAGHAEEIAAPDNNPDSEQEMDQSTPARVPPRKRYSRSTKDAGGGL
ncbi:uncharacterized protein LOC127751958 [Frankliniella occidentalis]|uniref:Uncharacterized protein LOC127751958 n=1 Tax=Frankliniella occidentalis TaxID=133901 RepID=A0A9C6XAN9_FRAOC|nr:uncharacterized protein LOC127751958 [Frankliniella occidentalis]